MSTRYDVLQDNEDSNNLAQLDESQDAHPHGRNSNDSEFSQDPAESEVPSALSQHREDEDVHTSTFLFQADEQCAVRPTTIMRRIGKLPLTILLLSIPGTIAFILYITFLWFAASGNTAWKEIALSGWITRSIAIAAVVLRTVTTAQAGIASSMLAAIALESSAGVSLPDLAPLSLMRASSAAPYAILLHRNLICNQRHWWLVTLASLLTITTATLQFTSTILLSDINSGFIARNLVTYNYVYPTRRLRSKNSWTIAPLTWPTFAEYTGNNASNGSLGYSDTGVAIRALLPFDDAQSRLIHAYEGPAAVIDARTICVRPNITGLWLNYDGSELSIYGRASIPPDMVSVLSAATPFSYFGPHGNQTAGFACTTSRWQRSDFNKITHSLVIPQLWDLSICDIERPVVWKEVFSEKIDLKDDMASSVFLLVNYTGYERTKEIMYREEQYPPLELANFNDSTPGLRYHNSGEWLDLRQDPGILSGPDTMLNFSSTKLSFSLCMPVFKGLKLNISAHSGMPLKQPIYNYNAERRQFHYDEIREQLLGSTTKLPHKRGVLSLQPPSMLSPLPYPFTMLRGLLRIPYNGRPWYEGRDLRTIHLLNDFDIADPRSDSNIGGLGLEILQKGGTVAEAMQSMTMAVVLADYQRHGATEVASGTKGSEAALRSDFVPIQIPGGNGKPANNSAGATRSYVIVMFVTVTHSFLVGVTIMIFIRDTKMALLWQNWHTVSQIISAVTVPYLSQASLATDCEVKKQMKVDGTSHATISINRDRCDSRSEIKRRVVRQ